MEIDRVRILGNLSAEVAKPERLIRKISVVKRKLSLLFLTAASSANKFQKQNISDEKTK